MEHPVDFDSVACDRCHEVGNVSWSTPHGALCPPCAHWHLHQEEHDQKQLADIEHAIWAVRRFLERLLGTAIVFALVFLLLGLIGMVFGFPKAEAATPVSPPSSSAALDLQEVSIPQFCHAFVKGFLGMDYVIAPDVLASDRKVSLSIKKVEKEKGYELAKSVLAAVGVTVSDKSGVLYLSSLSVASAEYSPSPTGKNSAVPDSSSSATPALLGSIRDGDEVRVYWPRYRSVAFLSTVVRVVGVTVVAGVGQGSGAVSVSGAPSSSSAASQSADSLVFFGTPEALKRADDLLEKVDVSPGVVSIRAAVLEVTDTSEESRSLSSVVSLLTGKIGVTYEAGQKAINSLTIKNSSLQAVLSAVDGDSRFRYVAEPSLRVVDGESASLTVGSEVPIRGQMAYDKAGNTIQAVEYKTAGVVLNVSPRIFRDVVLLKIQQQISSFAVTTTSNIDSPTVMKRQSETTVDAKPGDVVVLAGLDESREASSSSGLSFLPSWMQSVSKGVSRSQIVLLLQVEKSSN
jgi:type II secretory pathway component GspD/PulD (secretin)